MLGNDSDFRPSQSRDLIPHHVGFIMDGNGRWAQQRNLPRSDGHSQGATTLRAIVRAASERGISQLTCYALSTENYVRRSDEEIGFLMQLLVEHLHQERDELKRMEVQFKAIGRLEVLPEETQETLSETIKETSSHRGMVLRLAINYGGRAEIADAMESICNTDIDLRGQDEKSKEQLLSQHLYEPKMPDLDLLIRTGGEIRISNFLLWQCSYAELFFTPVLWPDFSEENLDSALSEYAQRIRRFGSIPTGTTKGDA